METLCARNVGVTTCAKRLVQLRIRQDDVALWVNR